MQYTRIPSTWKEIVDDESPSLASFEPDASRAVMVYDVPFADVQNTGVAIGTILGYSYRDNNKKLRRSLPLAHPYYPGLWATKIQQIQPRGPGTRDANGNYVSNRTPPYNPAADSSFIFPSPYVGGSYAVYNTARITILYEARDYLVIDDGTLQNLYDGDESQRYVSTLFHPAAKFLTNARGGFVWAETSATGPQVGHAVNASISRLDPTADVSMVWHQVPGNGLFASAVAGGATVLTIPANVLSVVGTVNAAAWHGFPAGTLLCMPPTFHPHTYPIAPAALDGAAGPLPAGCIPLYWDVEFVFKFYNPPTGATVVGHNTVPYFGDYLNYGVQVQKGTPPRQPYPTGNFAQLFTLN